MIARVFSVLPRTTGHGGMGDELISVSISHYPPAGVAAPKFPERTKKPIDTWDQEDKEGKEIGHTGGAKLVSGDAQITNMANKTGHICG